MTTEVRVISEGTAELQVPHSCPTCDGALELRISPDGARSFCATCHTIGKPRLHQDPHHGIALYFRDVGRC